MAEKLGLDAGRFTRDEATELCVYHLRMAAAFYQLVPDDDNEALRSEIIRQNQGNLVEVDITPAMLWAGAMYAAYNEMKERD